MKAFKLILIIIVSFALLLNLATWLVAHFLFPTQDAVAILHFTEQVGIDFIGPGSNIYTLPIIGLILLFTNLGLARLIYTADRYPAWLLVIILPVLQSILLIATINLWRIN